MLEITSKSTLDENEKFGCIMRGMCAVDPESGAYLKPSYGRSSHEPKYFLILPAEPPADRGGFLAHGKSYDFERSIIRAWSEQEAIELANKRLPLLQARAQHRLQRIGYAAS